MIEIFYILLVTLAAPYFFGPFIVKANTKVFAQPSFESIDEASVSSKAANYFQTVQPELKRLGFEHLGYLYQDQQITNVSMFVSVFVNPTAQNLAMAGAILARIKNLEQYVYYVEFGTQYADGSQISTNNLNMVNSFDDVSWAQMLQLPKIRDLSTLYQIQRGLEGQKFGSVAKEVLPTKGNLADLIAQDLKRVYDSQIDMGKLKLNAQQTHYVPTWKGAFIMSLRQLFPLKTIKILKTQRIARKILQNYQPVTPS